MIGPRNDGNSDPTHADLQKAFQKARSNVYFLHQPTSTSPEADHRQALNRMVAIAAALAYSSQTNEPKFPTTNWPDFAASTHTSTWIADLLPHTVYRPVFVQHCRKSSQTWNMVKSALRTPAEHLSQEPPRPPHGASRRESHFGEYPAWQMPPTHNLGQYTTNMILNPTDHQYPSTTWGETARYLDAFLDIQRIGLTHLLGFDPTDAEPLLLMTPLQAPNSLEETPKDAENQAQQERNRVDEVASRLLSPAFTMTSIERDGHCLFGSIAHGAYGDRSRKMELRQLVVQLATAHGAAHFNACKQTWGIADATPEVYRQRLLKGNDWGDTPEIMALANILHRGITVHVINDDPGKESIRTEHYPNSSDKPTIHIVFVGKNQYHAANATDPNTAYNQQPTTTEPPGSTTAATTHQNPTIIGSNEYTPPPHLQQTIAADMSHTPRVVPRSLRAFTLYRHHGLPIAGHTDFTRTYAAIIKAFWWKNMTKHIKRWIAACDCALRKKPRPLKTGIPRSILAPYPAHTWSIDLQGPLPITAQGNKYILTMQCIFSRYPEAIPLPDTKASTISDAIFRHLLTVHGRPSVLLSDRGRNLIGKAMQHLCKRWDIKKINTSGYQPQANPVERFHRYLNVAMTTLQGNFGIEWDRYLPAALFVYRNTTCESTGYTPYFLMYGRESVLPQSIFTTASPQTEYDTEKEYATSTCTQLAAAYRHAFDQQMKAAERNANFRAKYMHQTVYTRGQKVIYWQPTRQHPDTARSTTDNQQDQEEQEDQQLPSAQAHVHLPSKWTFKWNGPHVIVKACQSNTDEPTEDALGPTANVYEVRNGLTGKIFKANVNRLAPTRPWNDDIQSTNTISSLNRGFQTTGEPDLGSLVIVPFKSQTAGIDNTPCIIGKVLKKEADGSMELQWIWNAQGNMLGRMEEGWISLNRNKPL